MAHEKRRKKLHDGFSDNLEQLQALDLSEVKTVNDLVKGMKNTAFGGRTVGEAAEVLHAMTTDKNSFNILTLSGAMTMAQMGLVICDMIDHDMVDAVVSTGALMAHGFVESIGMRHFKTNPNADDEEFYLKGYNRVYDTVELEKNLDDTEEIIKTILDEWDEEEVLCSWKFNQALGEYLKKKTKGRGILKSAFEKSVPVYIPAFTDSEVGLDVGIYNRRREKNAKKQIMFNPYHDLDHVTELIAKQKKIGIFTIGGGVPRNWAQQIAPYLDIIEKRLGTGGGFKRYDYAVRICPEPAHWGGLSGATYSESISWGKITPQQEGGRYVEVYSDATIAWPMIVKAVLERIK